MKKSNAYKSRVRFRSNKAKQIIDEIQSKLAEITQPINYTMLCNLPLIQKSDRKDYK